MTRQETPTQSTGAHRRHRAPAGRARTAERERERRPRATLPLQPPGHYEPYLDGLFTYCLSILCEHDAATAALGEALALAERQRARLRDAALRRPWLYALARWACLRRLAAGPPPLPPARAAGGAGEGAAGTDGDGSAAEQRRAQLASLAWPEAAGTTPEQREALELAVRHQLTPAETGHVLGLDAEAARTRLARAACEVERTRTALAVVDSGRCTLVAQLAGETQVLLGTALRAELVRHVDECAVCRRTAERVVAAEPWPGSSTTGRAAGSSAVLALVAAPRPAVHTAQLRALEAGVGRAREATPRFDRRGFPLDLRDRAARRAQLRHRAVTTTVVAAVVAAPVLALWTAYRAAPLGEDGPGHGDRASSSEHDGPDGVPYQRTGSTVAPSGSTTPAPAASSATPGAASPTVTVTAGGAGSPAPGGGRLAVSARPGPDATTLVTLTSDGTAPVRWSAATSAYWLTLSARSGQLRPGASLTLTVTVDPSLEPSGAWTAEIDFSPGDAVVTLHGSSSRSGPPPTTSSPPSTTPPPTTPPPTTTPPATGSPTPTPPSSPPPTATATPSPSGSQAGDRYRPGGRTS